MKSLPLVLCVLALLASVVLAVLCFQIGNSKRILETQLVAARTSAAALDTQLAAAGEQNTSLEKRLTTLDNDLGETKSRLTTTEARNIQLARELTQTKDLVAAHDQAERALGEQIESLQRDLTEARNAAVPPGAIEAYKTTISDLERQLANAQNGAAAPSIPGASTAVFAIRSSRPANATAVVSVGPSNAFVVLNYGTSHGAQNGQTLDILRGTQPVASVLISDVRPNFSIAQVRPDSLRAALHKGDSAVLTN